MCSVPKEANETARDCWRLSWWAGFADRLLSATRPDYVAIEDYAFAARGRSYQIAELGGQIRRIFASRLGIKVRLFDPMSIKMYAAHNGAAQKPEVEEAVRQRWQVDFTKYNAVTNRGTVQSETSGDLVDAFCVAKLMWLEHRLREGAVRLESLPPKELRIFLRATKARPVNLLGEDLWVTSGETAPYQTGVSAFDSLKGDL